MTTRAIYEVFFLKDDTFARLAVLSEFCFQPATAVNVLECLSTSFTAEKVKLYLFRSGFLCMLSHSDTCSCLSGTELHKFHRFVN